MFDVFRAAKASKGPKSTTVKVAGAKLPMLGLPKEYTPAGYAALAKEQATNIVAMLPKVETDEELSASSKAELSPDEAALWCLRDPRAYGEETVLKSKGKGKDKPYTDRDTVIDVALETELNGQAK